VRGRGPVSRARKAFRRARVAERLPAQSQGGARCDDLLRQNGADTARLAASSRLCKVLSAGDGAGEAATQLGRALARADRRQNNDRPTGLLKPKEVAAAFAKATQVQEAGLSEKEVLAVVGGVAGDDRGRIR
jgi:hypothetical protein